VLIIIPETIAIQRTTAARPDAGHPSPYLNDHSKRHFSILPPANAAATRDVILRNTPHWQLVRRHSHDGPRISGQVIVVIVLCAIIALCALVGCCLLRLPAMCPCLYGRFLRSGASTSSVRDTPRSSSMPGFFDVEMMGDQPMSLASGPSPPPPYSRAPSYETSESTTGGRRDCTS
jgi:hypothetical protein